ncbi:MAG: DUF2283 domain-containing protein [Nanoarchaeota archaeon]|nr:DUF2283 domain-containing protein [Nanoarchaeota archaeon]
MAKGNTEIKYNGSEDILSFWKGEPSQASIEIGDFIVDIGSRGYVVGFEVINASENLDVIPEFLENIEQASMSVVYKPNYVYITLKVKLKGQDKDISIPLTVDLGHKKVEKEMVVFSK